MVSELNDALKQWPDGTESIKWEGKEMKKILVQLYVIGALIATYVLPVLACGGGGD
jgi:hypothetical protein